MYTRNSVAGSLSIAAAVVLIVALFLGWYAISATLLHPGSRVLTTTTFHLGQTLSESSSCSGLELGCPSPTSTSSTYSGAGLNDTGHLYAVMEVAVVIGVLLGIIGGGLLLTLRKGKPPSWATYLILAALVMAVVAPVGLSVLQPSALSNDSYAKGMPASAATSFVGSCNETTCAPPNELFGVSESWGPGAGWYLAFVAIVLFLASLLVARAGPSRSVASSTPAASGSTPVPAVEAPRTTP